jgi:hypothetical protein
VIAMTDARPHAEPTPDAGPHAEPGPAARAQARRERRRDAALAAGFFAGPLAWFADLVGGYALVQPSRQAGSKAWLFALTVFALALCAAGAAAAWHVWRGLEPPPAGSDEGLARDRTHFFALSGLAMSAFSFLVILAQALPEVVHRLDD